MSRNRRRRSARSRSPKVKRRRSNRSKRKYRGVLLHGMKQLAGGVMNASKTNIFPPETMSLIRGILQRNGVSVDGIKAPGTAGGAFDPRDVVLSTQGGDVAATITFQTVTQNTGNVVFKGELNQELFRVMKSHIVGHIDSFSNPSRPIRTGLDDSKYTIIIKSGGDDAQNDVRHILNGIHNSFKHMKEDVYEPNMYKVERILAAQATADESQPIILAEKSIDEIVDRLMGKLNQSC